ncbi:protein SCAF11 [Rhinoraja longicauda]
MGDRKLKEPTSFSDNEDFEGEENEQEQADNGLFVQTTDKIDWCPICLNLFVEQEVAVPESCSHVFCLRCILTWAEKLSSCPIDRKPFSVVYKQDNIKSNTKIPVKQCLIKNSREQRDSNIKGHYVSVTREHDGICTCIKDRCKRHRDDWEQTEFCEKHNISIIACNKRSRSSQKTNNKVNRKKYHQPCVRNDLNSFSPQYGKSEMSLSQAENCTEFVDVCEIAPLIRQKRRGPESLRLPWRNAFTALTTEMLRQEIGLISVGHDEADIALPLRDLMSGTPFLSNPLEMGRSVDFPGKKCTLAGTRGGGEKNNKSGTSGNTNAGNSESSQGRRRSMRISKAENLDKSASSSQRSQSGSGTSVSKASLECAQTPPKKAGKQKTKRKLENEQSKIPSEKKKTRVTRSSYKKSDSSSSDPNDSPFVSETEPQPLTPISTEKQLIALDNSNSSHLSANGCNENITSIEKDKEEEVTEKEQSHGENTNPCVDDDDCVPITDPINVDEVGNSNLPPSTDDENFMELNSGKSTKQTGKEMVEMEQYNLKDQMYSINADVPCTSVSNNDKDTGTITYPESPSIEDDDEVESKARAEDKYSEQHREAEFTGSVGGPEQVPACMDVTENLSTAESTGINVDAAPSEEKMSLKNTDAELNRAECAEVKDDPTEEDHKSDYNSDIDREVSDDIPGKPTGSGDLMYEMPMENIKPEQLKNEEPPELLGTEKESDCRSSHQYAEAPGIFMEDNSLKHEITSENLEQEQFDMDSMKALNVPEDMPDCKIGVDEQLLLADQSKDMENGGLKSEISPRNIGSQFEMELSGVSSNPNQASDPKSGFGQQSPDEILGETMEGKCLKNEPSSDVPSHVHETTEKHEDKKVETDLLIEGVCSSGPEDFNVDNNEVVAMECDSPTNDYQIPETESESKKNSKVGGDVNSTLSLGVSHEPPLPDASAENIKKEGPFEIELEKKSEQKEKDVPRRKSRFHAASITWSPEMERKHELTRSSSKSEGRSMQTAEGKYMPTAEGKSMPTPEEKSMPMPEEGSASKSQRRSNSRGRSGSKSRVRSRSRGRSRSRSRGKSRSRSRGGSWSKSRRRSRSKSRGRSRSRSKIKGRSRSRSQERSRSRGRSRSHSWGKDHHSHSDRSAHEQIRSLGDDGDRNIQMSPSHKKRSRSPSKEKGKDETPSESGKKESEADKGRKSRQRSRSRSRSRKRYHSGDKEDKPGFSPGRRDRNMDDSWRNARGKDRFRMNEWDRPRGFDRFRKDNRNREFQQMGRYPNEQPATDMNEYVDDRNPEWVMEQLQPSSDVHTRENEYKDDAKWEENRYERDDSWGNRNFAPGWKRGRGRVRGGSSRGDQSEIPWQNRRSNFSGEENNSGKYQGSGPRRYNDQQPNRWRDDSNLSSDVRDRSGWSSFSSWNARKTLPADVQNYYANRGRQSSGTQSSWQGSVEEQYQPTTEQADSSQGTSAFSDQSNQQINGSQQAVNVMQPVVAQTLNPPPSQSMSVFPYPLNVHPPLMHFHNPYIHPPPPLNVHAGISTVPPPTAAGNLPNSPPPPPPPPPPSQSVNYTVQQLDLTQPQTIPPPSGTSEVDLQTSAVSVPIPAGGSDKAVPVSLPLDISSSAFQSVQQVFATLSTAKTTVEKESLKEEFEVERPRKDKKGTIQERAVEEVKLAIKPYYQKKDITKDEYKEIVRKAVDKVCHSKSGEVIPGKVANLVKAYVEKYKHARKGNPKQNLEESSIIGNKSF